MMQVSAVENLILSLSKDEVSSQTSNVGTL